MIRGQPKGLFLLFFTEFWERFGFYMVQTILVLYMTKGLLYSDVKADLLYGTYGSMLYLTPVVGGYIADRFIGYKQSIILGGILLMIGYAVMAIPDAKALFLGLGIMAIANGFFKPNVSTIVGELYEPNDPRRDGGFTLFYMGINMGSVFPPIFAGALVAAFNWSSGFFAASVGMLISLATFIGGKHLLGRLGGMPSNSPLRSGNKVLFYSLLFLGIVIVIALLQVLFLYPKQSTLILVTASLAIIGSVLFFLFKERPEARRKLTACLILIVISVGFWAIYNQTFTSLILFADRNMSKEFLGLTLNAENSQFFNPFFIIILSPFISWFWVYLDEKKKNPSTPIKFTLGILFMALGFLFLWVGTHFFSTGAETSPWWLAGSYFLQTVGELFLSPIGLAMVTRLAPPHLTGMIMGVWFLTQSAAFAIGGGLATFASIPQDVSATASLAIYSHAFLIYGLIALALALVSWSLAPYLKRLIGVPVGYVGTPKQ
jgi:POT family proton-dependent oligopeptide transporter